MAYWAIWEKDGVTSWRDLAMLELELLLLSYPPSLQKGEHLPRFPVKRIPREDPMRSGERLNIGTDQVTEPTGTSGTSRAQAEDTEGFGQTDGIRKGQVRRGHKSPPSFPWSQDAYNGASKLPGPQRSHKMIGSTSQLAKQTPVPWTCRQQRNQYKS